jgi:hypothetical protein
MEHRHGAYVPMTNEMYEIIGIKLKLEKMEETLNEIVEVLRQSQVECRRTHLVPLDESKEVW